MIPVLSDNKACECDDHHNLWSGK